MSAGVVLVLVGVRCCYNCGFVAWLGCVVGWCIVV